MANKVITVIVVGGVVQNVHIPIGVQVDVEVRDYDVDGADNNQLSYDDDGDAFYSGFYKGAQS